MIPVLKKLNSDSDSCTYVGHVQLHGKDDLRFEGGFRVCLKGTSVGAVVPTKPIDGSMSPVFCHPESYSFLLFELIISDLLNRNFLYFSFE